MPDAKDSMVSLLEEKVLFSLGDRLSSPSYFSVAPKWGKDGDAFFNFPPPTKVPNVPVRIWSPQLKSDPSCKESIWHFFIKYSPEDDGRLTSRLRVRCMEKHFVDELTTFHLVRTRYKNQLADLLRFLLLRSNLALANRKLLAPLMKVRYHDSLDVPIYTLP